MKKLDSQRIRTNSEEVLSIKRFIFLLMFLAGLSHQYALSQTSALSYTSSPYNLSSVEYTGNSYDFSAIESTPRDIAFNDDGTKMYILGTDGGGWVRQFNLSSPYDIASISGSPTSISLLSYNSEPEGISFNSDGSKLFYLGRGGSREVIQFQVNLGAFDITGNMTPQGDPFSFSYLEESYPSDLTFNDNGTKMYILGYDKDSVKQYSLATPFVVNSGVTDDGNALYVGDVEYHAQGLEFSADGQYLYILGFHRDRFLQYKLNSPFDLTQGYESVNLNTLMEVLDYKPMGFAFDHTGEYVYILGEDTKTVYEYKVKAKFSEKTTNDGSVSGTLVINLENETFTNAGGMLDYSIDYVIHNLPLGLEPQLSVAADGQSAQMVLNGQAQLHQPEDDFSDLYISFFNSAFTGGDASVVAQATNASTGSNINFLKNDATLFAYATDETVSLNWPGHPNPGVTQYRVLQSIEGSDQVVANITRTGDGSDTTLIIQELENHRPYRYRVLALDDEDSVFNYTDINGQYLGGYETAIPNDGLGNVASFDGDNDYIQVPDDPLLKQSQGTVEFWIRMEKLPGGTNQHYAIANKHDPNGSHNGWNFYHNLDEFVFVVRDGSNPYRILSGKNLIDSTWHHIAFTYDLTGATPSVGYIDGDSIGAITLGSINISSQPIIIGRSFGTWWTQFEGQIDEFRIWDHQRTQEEITSMMRNRSDGADDGLVMVLNLDEPDGSTTANDGSKNNLNGTVIGDVEFSESTDYSRNPFISIQAIPDLKTATPVLNESITIPNEYPTGITFSPDGNKMYTVGELTFKRAYQYELDTAFDITSASTAGFLDIVQPGSPQGIQLSTDGSKMYLITTQDSIHQFELSTHFDITTAVYQGNSFYLGNETIGGFDFVFGNGGKKMFVVDLQNVYQYTLDVAYDITSATYDGISLWIGDEDNSNRGLTFSKEGTRMFIAGTGSDQINQYDLTTPFDLSTVTFSGSSFDVSGDGDVVRGLVFNNKNDQLYTIAQDSNKVSAYRWESVGFMESDSDDGSVQGGASLSAYGDLFTKAGGALIYGVDYTVTNLPSGLTPTLNVYSEGEYAILTLSGNATSHKAIHSVDELQIAFENSAFQGDSTSLVEVLNSGVGVQFSGSDAPIFISTNLVTVEENSTGQLLDIQANDGDGGGVDEGIMYTLDTGDGAHFTINGNTGVLSFTNSPDAENPLDADENNVYEITVTADDGTLTNTQIITVTVTNLNDNIPVIEPNQVFSLDENSPVSTIVGTVAVSDADAGTTFSGWNIIEGGPGFKFSIDADGQIILEGTVDYEATSGYQFYVEVSDGENDALSEEITIEINDLNEDPVLKTPLLDVELNEGFEQYGFYVAGFFEDPDDDELTISAVSSDPSVVDVSVVSGDLFFHEVGTGNATITVTADDGLLEVQTDFAVVVIDVNDAPVVIDPLSNQDFVIGFSTNTTNLEFVFDDPDNDDLTYSATSSNTDVVTVEIDGTSLIVHEGTSTGSATVEVTATDPSDSSVTTSFSVTVSDQSKTDQTIDFAPIPDKIYGDESFTLQASSSSGLPVSFSVVSGNAVIQGSTVMLTGAGSVVILATQAGDEIYNPATFQRGFEVAKADQTITIDPIADKLVTDPDFDVTASTTSGLTLTYEVSGPVSITGTTISLNGTGTVNVTVSQTGNGDYNAATAATSFTVTDPSKTDQTITFDALTDKTFGDAAFDLTATASSGLDVNYNSSNESVATISGNTVTIVGAGTTTITASQAGDADYNPASDVEQILTVNKADQTIITFEAITDKTYGDAAFDLTATSSSGLAVSYSSSDESVATISGSTVTIVGAGTTTITASQAGNADYNPATSLEQTLIVNKAIQSITFDAIDDQELLTGSVELAAVASSGLGVSFTLDAGDGSIDGNTLTFNNIGNFTVTATQAGNENYEAAEAVTHSFEVTDPTRQTQTITFEGVEGKVFGDPEFSLVATATSGLAVEFSVIEGSVTLAGNVVTINGAGTVTIAANQSGNEEYTPAPEVTQTFVISKAQATITITDLEQTVDDTAKEPAVITEPADLNFTITYDGSEDAPTAAGTYEVVVTLDEVNYEGEQTATFTLTEASPLGVEKTAVTVYPNPVTDYVLVTSPKAEDVSIYDLEGRLQATGQQGGRIDLTHLRSGIYLLISGQQKVRIIKR